MINFEYSPITGLVSWDFGVPLSTYNYARDKKKYVIFSNGKEKEKLRAYIRSKASFLAKMSKGNVLEIRKIFIEAYNIEGVKAVDMIYNQSIIKLLDNLK